MNNPISDTTMRFYYRSDPDYFYLGWVEDTLRGGHYYAKDYDKDGIYRSNVAFAMSTGYSEAEAERVATQADLEFLDPLDALDNLHLEQRLNTEWYQLERSQQVGFRFVRNK